MTFGAIAELYIAAHAPGWKGETYAREWRHSLRDYVLPTIGQLPVMSVDTGAVMQCLEPVWHAKPATASRVRQRIESILDYATARGWRGGDNPARWRGHLANLLPAKSRVAPVQHHAAMPWGDVPEFIAALSARPGPAAKALGFLILTATRSGEARGAVRREFNLQRGVWTIPAARMKTGREHRIPLSAAAIRIVQEQLSHDGAPDELVFPGASPAKPLSDVALAKLMPRGATVHGFRSSFRDWAAERTSFQRETIEMALAHRVGDAVEQAYARGDMFVKRRALMDTWATYLGVDLLRSAQ